VKGLRADHYTTGPVAHGIRQLPHLIRCIHIYGAIQEYAGFEEPRWLDGLY
jgi:hypothetical protein